ncbi:MAG: DUF2793 domain-containing protein [Synergistaceae bacterium]|nr:DUF2793 domain-containing protein [Synergistaceae bacterium]
MDRRFVSINTRVEKIANSPSATATPVNGTQYIVGSNPTGAFASANANANDLARYDGSKWKFTRPGTGQLEVLNMDTLEILGWNGTEWAVLARLRGENPVLDVVVTGTTLPASAEEGDRFLNTSNGKLYTATAQDAWDSGTTTNSGDRYASLSDAKIHENRDGTFIATPLADGTLFLSKADSSPYGYDADTDRIIKLGGESSTVTESHVLTAGEVAAKTFNLSSAVATGKENAVLLSACGVVQVAGTDFAVSGKAVSWTGKGLAEVDLAAGDVFVVSYQRKG